MRFLALLTLAAAPALAEGSHWIEQEPAPPRVAMPSLAPLVKESERAVLTIFVESLAGPRLDPNDPRIELFKRFGMNLEMPELRQQGQGSGFLITPDGYALTNHHVVEGADKIKVRVGSSSTLVTATVIGDDPRTDVALIKLEGKRTDWPALPLGDSDALQVGDFVVAIGNPFGLSQSVSMGILSARGRRDIAPSGRRGLYDFLQTDASINPGNSGGPLLNLAGEVIGINAAVNAAGQGIGFAIPSNLVKTLVPDLKKNGRVERAWIGVSIDKVDPEIAQGLGLDSPRGALVSSVMERSPAYSAGLKPGDVIVKFDGKGIDDASDLPLVTGSAGIGRTVAIELVRNGELRSARVTLAANPEDEPSPHVTAKAAETHQAARLGVRIDDLDEEYRRRLDLPKKQKGAIIVGADPAGVAAAAGLKAGDVVTELNGKRIASAEDFVKIFDNIAPATLVKLIVLRRGSETFVAFNKP